MERVSAFAYVRARVDARDTFKAPFVWEWSATDLNNPSVNLNHFPPDRRGFVQPNTNSHHAPEQRAPNAVRTQS